MANTIEYADSPNVDTAFVVQEGGQKNRAVLTAPQDTTTLELPDNPNSTKGYVTIDGKKHKVILTADISGNGGGGGGAVDSVNGKTGVVVLDATDVGAVPQYETMPTADASNVGEIAQYSGATAGSYTNGYFYQSIIALNVLSGTVEFNPASISGTTVTCSGADFANFVANWGSGNITDIIKGTLTYDQSGGLLVFVGQDDTDTQVCTFQLYTQDYEDAGFTFTGTLQDGDVFAFTCTITETSVYDWTRIDVQPQPVIPDPLPDQTGQSGKFLTTDGTNASWSNKPLVNKNPTSTDSLFIGGDGGSVSSTGTNSISITSNMTYSGWISLGYDVVCVGSKNASGDKSISIGMKTIGTHHNDIVIGYLAGTRGNSETMNNIAIGHSVQIGAVGVKTVHAIQLGSTGSITTNNDSNTFKVANANGNFEMMNANGNIPADRIADTTGLTAGNYLPRLTIDAQGNKTITWVAE